MNRSLVDEICLFTHFETKFRSLLMIHQRSKTNDLFASFVRLYTSVKRLVLRCKVTDRFEATLELRHGARVRQTGNRRFNGLHTQTDNGARERAGFNYFFEFIALNQFGFPVTC